MRRNFVLFGIVIITFILLMMSLADESEPQAEEVLENIDFTSADDRFHLLQTNYEFLENVKPSVEIDSYIEIVGIQVQILRAMREEKGQ